MTWTFDLNRIGEDSIEGIRYGIRSMVGDTDPDDELIQDEEIDWIVRRWLPLQGSIEFCGAMVADSIANKFAREASYSADGVSIGLSQIADQFRALSSNLREQHKEIMSMGAVPDFGGALRGEQMDPSLRNFSFGTQMHDNHNAGQQDYGSRDYRSLTEEEEYF